MSSSYLSFTGKHHETEVLYPIQKGEGLELKEPEGVRRQISSSDVLRGKIRFGNNEYTLPEGLICGEDELLFAYFQEGGPRQRLDDVTGDPLYLPEVMNLTGVVRFLEVQTESIVSSHFPKFGTGGHSEPYAPSL